MIAGRSTRMEVLELLRRKGHASAETIASDLGVTPNAVRQHLTNLERDGFVVSHPERRRRGRPSLLFSLTERADSVFPKRYGQLASMVLQEVQEMGGPDALDEVFARMATRHAKVIAKTSSRASGPPISWTRSEEHTSEFQSRFDLVCRPLLETKKIAERLQSN